MKILAVYGSSGPQSQSARIISFVSEAATAAGASVEKLDLLQTPLPLFRPDQSFGEEPIVQQVKRQCSEALAFLLVSPEYHGCMSSWMKNFFDFHYHEFAGKAFGLAASTGGSMGVSCNTQMRVAIQHCHGWALPYQVAVRKSDFGEDGRIHTAAVLDRLLRMGKDLKVYGELLHRQFAQDRAAAAALPSDQRHQGGFAGWYV